MEHARTIWRRGPDRTPTRIDRHQALEAIQRTLAMGAACIAAATWYQKGFLPSGDPVVPVTLSIAFLMGLAPWATRHLPLEIRVLLFHAFTLGFTAMYVIMRYFAGNPVESTAYVAVPVLGALVLSSVAASVVTVFLATAWTALVTLQGWVTIGPDDLVTTGALLLVAVPTAALLARERHHSRGWVHAYQQERFAVDSLLRACPSPVIVLDRTGSPTVANGPGAEWLRGITHCAPGEPKPWSALEADTASEWNDAFDAACKGQTRELLFCTGKRTARRWHVHVAPCMRTDGVIAHITDVTKQYPNQTAFHEARRATRNATLRPARYNTGKPTGPVKENPGTISESMESLTQ